MIPAKYAKEISFITIFSMSTSSLEYFVLRLQPSMSRFLVPMCSPATRLMPRAPKPHPTKKFSASFWSNGMPKDINVFLKLILVLGS